LGFFLVRPAWAHTCGCKSRCELVIPALVVEALRRQVHEKLGYLITLELLLQDGLAVFIDCVNLKHVLGQVDANCCNLYGGRLSRFKCLI
jgi:hypothetical protein